MAKELIVEDVFTNLPVEKQIKIGDKLINVPTKYFGRVISGVFSADTKEVKELINYEKLKPVKVSISRGTVIITIFDNFDTPVGPYKEIVLATPVLHNPKISVPLIPLLFQSQFKNLGFFVFCIASDTDISREEGAFFGYPHHEKNIQVDFQEDNSRFSARLEEDSAHILSFDVRRIKKEKVERADYQTYFIKDKKIFRIKMNTIAIVGRSLNKACGTLELGNHAISDLLKKLKINIVPLEVSHYRNTVEVLNIPEELKEE